MSIQINALKELSLKGSDYAKKTGPDRYDIYEQEAKPPLIPLIAFIKLKEKKVDKFDGSFGFDWLEYNVEQKKYTHVQGTPISSLEKYFDAEAGKFISNLKEEQKIEKVKLDYEQLVEVKDMDYRMPYLSMKAGQTIELTLDVQVLPYTKEKQDRTPNDLAIVITTINTANYEVELKRSDSLKSIKKDKKITFTIRCLQPSTYTLLTIENKDGNIVGGLRIVDNTQTNTINIRMVALLEKPSNAKDADSYARLMLDSMNIQSLEKYLNENSLNQANIQAVIEKENNKLPLYYLNFDPAAPGWKDYMQKEDGVMKFKDKVDEKDLLLEELERQYKQKYAEAEKLNSFKGILLFVTREEKLSQYKSGGESKPVPVDYNNIVIFGNRLNDSYAYAHEMGHLLGLQHVFSKDADEDQKFENGLQESKKWKSEHEERIARIKSRYCDQSKFSPEDKKKWGELDKEWGDKWTKKEDTNTSKEEKQSLQNRMDIIKNKEKPIIEAKYVKDEEVTGESDRKLLEEDIAALKKDDEALMICIGNKYRFKQGDTFNIMDYPKDNTQKKNLFSHLQWNMMKTDTKFTQ